MNDTQTTQTLNVNIKIQFYSEELPASGHNCKTHQCASHQPITLDLHCLYLNVQSLKFFPRIS